MTHYKKLLSKGTTVTIYSIRKYVNKYHRDSLYIYMFIVKKYHPCSQYETVIKKYHRRYCLVKKYHPPKVVLDNVNSNILTEH